MPTFGNEVKQEELETLRARIVREMYLERWLDVWFFPEANGVRGWQGIQDIMFVGLNPSTGRFPSEPDQFLYAQLIRNDFQEAHLTDAIKCRGTASQVQNWLKDDDFLRQQMDYLKEEISLTNPRLIVPVGQKCANLLRSRLGVEVAQRIELVLPHYR